MIIKLPGDIEIQVHIYIMTKRKRVMQDVECFGTIKAVNRFKDRYKCDFKEAFNYFKKIGQWPETK